VIPIQVELDPAMGKTKVVSMVKEEIEGVKAPRRLGLSWPEAEAWEVRRLSSTPGIS
jgi:hypothetical protein